MMRFKAVYGFLCLFPVVLASCNRSGLMANTPVRLERPGIVVGIEHDSSFSSDGLDSLSAIDIQLVSDSLLVIRRRPNENNPYCFSAYSIRSSRYLGSFLPLGRGPGEVLQPNVADCGVESGYLNINDNSLRRSWQVDVMSSIYSNKSVFPHVTPLPDNTVDWIPITDTLQLVLNLEQKDLLHQFLDARGQVKTTLNPFHGIDAERYITHLSALLTSNTEVGKMASFMVCFPQLYILDAQSLQWKAIAVDDRFRRWKVLLNEPFTMEKDQYYTGATSSQHYIIASYCGYSLEKVMKGGHGSEIHIFDWGGNYLCKLIIKEVISSLTYDHKFDHLYCIEQSTGRILRYDLSAILSKLPV